MKGYFMPENDKTNQTNTDISLPKEEWEKKLLENEKTAFTEFPLPQDPNEKSPQTNTPYTAFGPRCCWPFLPFLRYAGCI